MAVPKKRSSKATVRQRRSHDALKQPNLIFEPNSNSFVLRKYYKAAKLGLLKKK